ncbi:MAG: hypothetical protein AMXMBFR82_03740 [Candidatus Hydrogenedentota bacterium]
MRHEGLAAAGWADEQDIGLLKFDPVDFAAGGDTLVMIVDRDGENPFGPLLTDDILVEEVFDFGGFWYAETFRNPFASSVLGDNFAAEADTLVAYVYVWPGDQFADLIVALAAERTGMYITSGAMWGHRNLPYELPCSPVL